MRFMLSTGLENEGVGTPSRRNMVDAFCVLMLIMPSHGMKHIAWDRETIRDLLAEMWRSFPCDYA